MEELELATTVLKKSSKSPLFWQSRYFLTKLNRLQYWTDKASHERDPHTPSSEFDVCDFKVVDYKVGRLLDLLFSESKHGLHLQFQTETEAREWYELLLAKRSLYLSLIHI